MLDKTNEKLFLEYSKLDKHNKYMELIVIFLMYVIIGFMMTFLLPNEYRNTGQFYTFIILLSVFFASLAEKSSKILISNVFFFLSFFTLFFILGFRNFSGIDDPSYIFIFNNVSQNGWLTVFKTTTMEPGFLILNRIISFFTKNYLYMQLISALIPMILFYKGFNKYKFIINVPMAVFLLATMLYFQMLSASLIRMFIAISIVFNSFYYIPRKKIKKFIIIIISAASFHYSALIMLVFTYFFINKKNLSAKAFKFVTLIFFSLPIVFLLISNILVPILGSRYSAYGSVNNLSLTLTNFDTLPILFMMIFFNKRFRNIEALHYKILLIIFTLSSIISFYSSMVSLGRIIFYTNSAFFIAAPMVSKRLKGSKKIVFSGIIIFYGFLYLYVTQFFLEGHIPFLFPYKNFFFTW